MTPAMLPAPRRFAAAGLLAGILAAWQHPALAHAIIIDSTPAVNAAVAGPDVNVRLHFNSRIDQKRSRLALVGPGKKETPVTVEPDDAPDMLVGRAAEVAPGQYRLRWQVLAIDGHITRGDIPFTVSH
jgi:copper resistance protein C